MCSPFHPDENQSSVHLLNCTLRRTLAGLAPPIFRGHDPKKFGTYPTKLRNNPLTRFGVAPVSSSCPVGTAAKRLTFTGTRSPATIPDRRAPDAIRVSPMTDRSSTPATLLRYSTGERLFIWGLRATAQFRRLGWPGTRELRQVYDHFNVADALPSLDTMLEVFACTAHTPIELHCAGCPCISPSEYGVLQAVARAQRGDVKEARKRFESWLPGLASDWIMAPACGLGRIFADAGLVLPTREAEAPPAQVTTAMRSWPIGSATLH